MLRSKHLSFVTALREARTQKTLCKRRTEFTTSVPGCVCVCVWGGGLGSRLETDIMNVYISKIVYMYLRSCQTPSVRTDQHAWDVLPLRRLQMTWFGSVVVLHFGRCSCLRYHTDEDEGSDRQETAASTLSHYVS